MKTSLHIYLYALDVEVILWRGNESIRIKVWHWDGEICWNEIFKAIHFLQPDYIYIMERIES
jgi:hypothetical protein